MSTNKYIYKLHASGGITQIHLTVNMEDHSAELFYRYQWMGEQTICADFTGKLIQENHVIIDQYHPETDQKVKDVYNARYSDPCIDIKIIPVEQRLYEDYTDEVSAICYGHGQTYADTYDTLLIVVGLPHNKNTVVFRATKVGQ